MTPESDFFFTIEKETKRLGVPLIIDEVTSGFRLNCGGLVNIWVFILI